MNVIVDLFNNRLIHSLNTSKFSRYARAYWRTGSYAPDEYIVKPVFYSETCIYSETSILRLKAHPQLVHRTLSLVPKLASL